MFLLSKIIAKEWFKSLIGAVVVLFILITVGDIVNGFLRSYSAQRVFIEYILKMPDLMGKMLPISSLLATLFSINKLKSHAELIAILAGGYSALKVYLLIFLCSLSIGLVQFINLGFLLPEANLIKRSEFEKSKKNESKYLARSKLGGTGLLWYKSENYFSSFKAYDRVNKALKDVTFYFYNDSGKTTSIYKAKSAKFIKDFKWEFDDLSILQFLDGHDFPKVNAIRKLLVTLKEQPSDFGQFESDITTLSFFSLYRFISRLKNTGINSSEYEIMLYEKVSLSLICIIFSLFPLASVFTPNRRGSSFGKSVVLTLIFTIGFWLIYSSVIAMGNNGSLPPIIATMGIPSIFIIYILNTIRVHRSLK
jgi:lipopolysaccharide export system permease protein